MGKRKTQTKIPVVAKFTEYEYILMIDLVGQLTCALGYGPANAQFSKGEAGDADADAVEWLDADAHSILRLVHYSEGDTDPEFDEDGDYIPAVYVSIHGGRLGREMMVDVIRVLEDRNIYYEVDKTDVPLGEMPVMTGQATVH